MKFLLQIILSIFTLITFNTKLLANETMRATKPGGIEPIRHVQQEATIPRQNPHPPLTAQDKTRVEFATKAIQKFLIDQNFNKDFVIQKSDAKYTSKNQACLDQPSCYEKDISFMNEMVVNARTKGRIIEIRHPHVIPWSVGKGDLSQLEPMRQDPRSPKLEPGDLMVHTYALFEDSKGWQEWFHLDVIFSEDKTGQLGLKYFYMISIPTPRDTSNDLPPGVKC